jgi:hypothetical protein
MLVALLASGARAYADDPPKVPDLVQVPTEGGAQPEDNSRPAIEPTVTHPPWSGREAIWGGVGLIVAGAGTLIIGVPISCTTSNNASLTPCYAMAGGSGGALLLGGIVLLVGEMQRASYKEWLRTHPMFAGWSVSPSGRGTKLAWSVPF